MKKDFFVAGMGYEQHQLGSNTKNDVMLKARIELQQEHEEEGTHGQAYGQAHDRAARTEGGSVRVNERERKKREWIVLTLDLDIDFTTKSMSRALKLV